MALGKAEFEQSKLQTENLDLKIAVVTHTNQANIKTFCVNVPSVVVYHEDDTRLVTSVDPAPGFALTDLDNDAPPGVIGVVIPVGDAAELLGVELIPGSISSKTSLSATMTAAVMTPRGAAASGYTALTGVTASGNLAFTLSLTTLNIDEDDETQPNLSFWLRVKYRKRQPGY